MHNFCTLCKESKLLKKKKAVSAKSFFLFSKVYKSIVSKWHVHGLLSWLYGHLPEHK